MYRIHVRQHFDAAHYLRGYEGRCEELHGHRWDVVVALETAQLNEIDLGYDFTHLKRILGEEVLARLDHRCLNDVPPFDRINASTENLARVIYGWLAGALGEAPVHLAYVEVYESPDSWVRYVPPSQVEPERHPDGSTSAASLNRSPQRPVEGRRAQVSGEEAA